MMFNTHMTCLSKTKYYQRHNKCSRFTPPPHPIPLIKMLSIFITIECLNLAIHRIQHNRCNIKWNSIKNITVIKMIFIHVPCNIIYTNILYIYIYLKKLCFNWPNFVHLSALITIHYDRTKKCNCVLCGWIEMILGTILQKRFVLCSLCKYFIVFYIIFTLLYYWIERNVVRNRNCLYTFAPPKKKISKTVFSYIQSTPFIFWTFHDKPNTINKISQLSSTVYSPEVVRTKKKNVESN